MHKHKPLPFPDVQSVKNVSSKLFLKSVESQRRDAEFLLMYYCKLVLLVWNFSVIQFEKQ